MNIAKRKTKHLDFPVNIMKYRQQRGIILIFVIVTISVLALLATEYVVSVRRNNSLVSSMIDRSKLNYTAVAGVQYAIYMMQETDSELRYKDDGRIYSFSINDSEVSVKITPELGKVDINQADEGLIAQIITSNGIEEKEAYKLADNIIHWRSKSNVAYKESVGDDDYKSSGLQIPQHRRFYAIDELASVFGIDAELYSYLKPLITVYGGRRISVYSATDEVMRALGMTGEEIEKVNQARQDYYNNDQKIPSDVIAINTYLTASLRAAYYRIISSATENDNQVSVYSVIKKRKENNTYREYESGILTGTESAKFLSEIENQAKIEEANK